MKLSDVLFPRRCAGCRDGPWPFCDDCRAELTPLESPWCERCGRPTAVPAATCRDCPDQPITSARAPFRFDGPARAAVHRLKYAGWQDVGSALARAMATVGSASGVRDAHVVTWVPLARARLAARGYDQARVLARGLGRELDLPVQRLLRRTISTGPQARRSGAERRAALRGAFVATGPCPAVVVLVDDVLTTGATAASCARALMSAGAREVHLVVAARAFRGPLRSTSAGRPISRMAEGRVPRREGRAYTRSGSRPGLWLPEDIPR
jgi:ComF family protein